MSTLRIAYQNFKHYHANSRGGKWVGKWDKNNKFCTFNEGGFYIGFSFRLQPYFALSIFLYPGTAINFKLEIGRDRRKEVL